MRTIVIGDIHGCSYALDALLAKTRPEAGTDRLIFLGDLFDRGPDSFGVWQIMKKLADDFGERFFLLLGNHEDYLLQPQLSHRQQMIWEMVGRQATVHSFEKAGARMEDAVPWIRERVRLYWKTDGLQCVHAGLKLDPPDVNDLDTLVHNHETVLTNLYRGPLTITGHIALERASWFAGDGETVKELEDDTVMDLPPNGVICIDTGCGKGGRLTAMIINGRRFILKSVPEI